MMMQTRNAWWKLTAGILALTLGYTIFLVERGTVFAGPVKCAAPQQICQGEDCVKNDACKDGTCSAECPGNCPMNHKNV
jgi:hypothetical protein